MTRDPLPGQRLKHALIARGYQPARSDIPSLFALLADGDRESAEAASRALARLGGDGAREALTRVDGAPPLLRARLVRLIGRVAQAHGDRALAAFLLSRVADADDKTARNAALALGKLGETVARDEAERALLSRWSSAPPSLRRALAEALGKVGGTDALPLLDDEAQSDDAELRRLVDEARLKIQRTLGRQAPSEIRDELAPLSPLPVHAHCRHGLSRLLCDELKPHRARAVDDETVALTLHAPLASLWAARTMLRFGFPLPTARVDGRSDAAWAIVSRFSRGPIRYRLEWADAGHRRALTFRVAAQVATRRPGMINDPTATLWEAVVRERPRLSVELWPRGLADPRFAYRVAHVPASSHPTLAAALARVASVRADDVVWDPFVGAATELIERARLGPFRALFGTDSDEAALARARENLAAAHVHAALAVADARSFVPPEPPTLILTNPPLGRRVLDRHRTGDLYRTFLAHAASLLPRGGRLVWISPRGDETVGYATPLGLAASHRQRVDMAGFWAELQAFVKR